MTIERHWFDWNAPLLPAAARWLVEEHTRGATVDMEHVWCVTPGRRAGRLLIGAVIAACDDAGLTLLPPRMITPGRLADALLQDECPLATRIERILAWGRAVADAPATVRDPIMASAPDTPLAVYELARVLAGLEEELAGDGLRMAEVPARAAETLPVPSRRRWAALAQLEHSYRDVLAARGLLDPLAPRPVRVDAAGETIVLVGVVDLRPRQRRIIAEHAGHTAALVHAPSALADRFDDIGCPRTDGWARASVNLDDDAVRAAETPSDQAQCAIEFIADVAAHRRAGEITIGLGDPELGDAVRRAARWAGLGVHAAAGTPLTRTGPYRLLAATLDLLEDATPTRFASLVRHPDLERWLTRRNALAIDWIGRLDEYASKRLPGAISRDAMAAHNKGLGQLTDHVDELLAPLQERPRPLGARVDPVLAVLGTVYDREPAESSAANACMIIRDTIAGFASTSPEGQELVAGAAALAVFLAEVSGEHVPAEARPHEVEMLGWLELPLDPAPALVLIGCNDGHIPETVSGDPFLPDGLRRALGLMDNHRRYARDLYLLESIRRSRGVFRVVTGRTNDLGDPLTPSRLLLGGSDRLLLDRVRRFCDPKVVTARSGPPIGAPAHGGASRFTIPDLDDVGAPESMSVTDFKRYIECPYRYALQRRLRLKESTDRRAEMDPLQFGLLVHEALERFGKDERARDARDPEMIEGFLIEAFRVALREDFGVTPLPAVRLQAARAEERLRVFAGVQARTRREGWRIEHVEVEFDGRFRLDMGDDAPMPIRGKIDRIDRNEWSGAWRIIDYKTTESAPGPIQAHHGGKRMPPPGPDIWRDLQLPLYAELARQLGIDGDVQLAYCLLPKSAGQTDFKFADWTPEHLESALERARSIVRDVRAGGFAINPEFNRSFDSFARICQTSAFGGGDES